MSNRINLKERNRTKRQLIIAPSLLACDFSHIAKEVRTVEDAGADWLHIDVMDAHFVPNLTIGPSVIRSIHDCSRIPLDVHLMIDHPEKHIGSFIDAGSDFLTVHVEAKGLTNKVALRSLLKDIRKEGIRAGLSLKPRTNTYAIKPYLDLLDLVLVMSVEPGFGGQSFMPSAVNKVRQLREWFAGDIAVDGGVNAQTGYLVRKAGANVLVAGTYIFSSESYREAIEAMRGKE